MAPCKVLTVFVEYSFYERLNILLADFDANVENTEFSDTVTVTFSLKQEKVDDLQAKLTDLSNGVYQLKEIGAKFAKI